MTRVLVAHASKYGSVEEVARYVAAILRDRGVVCTVVPAREAEHVVDYDLVVLGAGLYMGRLHREARRFLKRHHADLADVPFAVFAMGPLSSEPEEKEKVRPQLDRALERFPEVTPCVREIFGGVIDPETMSFPFSHMPEGDYRDWDEIRAFALALPTTSSVPA